MKDLALAQRSSVPLGRRVFDRLLVAFGAVGLTLAFFLVLPVIQAISKGPDDVLELTSVDAGFVPPPPPPPPEEEPEEEEQEEEPPELEPEAPQPLDLSQLEMALNPGFSEGWLGDQGIDLGDLAPEREQVEDFDAGGFDQEPRPIYQPSPMMTAATRRKAPGQVLILLLIDERGKVADARVRSSTDKAFEKPALAAVKQWKFEPAKRNGQPVPYTMKAPIVFPKP